MKISSSKRVLLRTSTWYGLTAAALGFHAAGSAQFEVTQHDDSMAQLSAQFCASFDSGLPDGMTLFGDAVVGGGYLRLTPAASYTFGVASIDDFCWSRPITAFRATFTASLFEASLLPADGFSFNLIPNPGPDASPYEYASYEEGLDSGLAISFETYTSIDGGQPMIAVKWLGAVIARASWLGIQDLSLHDPALAAKPVIIELNDQGRIDLSYGGEVIFSQLQTPYTPLAGVQWVIGARTGLYFENHWFSDLCIDAVATFQPEPGPVHFVPGGEPTSVTLNPNDRFVFRTAVDGTPPYALQWYENDLPIVGATNLSYSGIVTPELDGARFRIAVSNEFGGILSSNAILTVAKLPEFILHPQSQTVAGGSDVTLSVSVSGTLPMSYRWRRSGSTITNLILNQNTCSLLLTNVTLSAAGVYTVFVTNQLGRATGGQSGLSSNAYLTVVMPPTDQAVTHGSNLTLQAQANGGSGNNLGFQWRLNETNLPGATSTDLTLTNVQFNQAGTYTFVVTNGAGQATGFDAILTVLPGQPPTISQGALVDHGPFRLRFAGEIGAPYTVQASTNLVGWEVLGPATETAPGTFEWADAEAPQHAQRFYRLRSP